MDEKRKPGRPKKIRPESEQGAEELRPPKPEDLGVDLQYFESEMKGFFQRGGMNRLQRWFIGVPRRTAEILGNRMVERFAEKLNEIMPTETSDEEMP